MTVLYGAARLNDSIRGASIPVVPYLTAGYPDMGTFIGHLANLAEVAPAVEVGLPFSDPMADGATIQESSRLSLRAGTTVGSVIESLEAVELSTPLIVMSYLNPLVAFGLDDLMARLAGVGVGGLVVPDLPLEEAGEIIEAANRQGIGIVQMVTPLTEVERMEVLCAASQGFVYAVTMTGTTGGSALDSDGVASYLDLVSERSESPVLAGFGVRNAEQVRSLTAHCDGVIVGSAVVEAIASGRDPLDLIRELSS